MHARQCGLATASDEAILVFALANDRVICTLDAVLTMRMAHSSWPGRLHAARPLAKRHSQRLGGGKRWIAVAKSGERLDLRRS